MFALLLCKVHLLCQQLQDHTLLKIMCINICKQCLKQQMWHLVRKWAFFEYLIFFAHFIWYCKWWFVRWSESHPIKTAKGLTRALLVNVEKHARVNCYCHSRNSHLMDLVPQTWEKRLHMGKWMKVFPACPGSATRWCSTPALWTLMSQQFFFFPSNSLSVLLAGPVQHLTPTVCALTGHQRTASFSLLVDFGSSTCFVITSAHQTGKLLQQIDLIFRQHLLSGSLLNVQKFLQFVARLPALYMYMCTYILKRQWLVFPSSVCVCAVLFSCVSLVLLSRLYWFYLATDCRSNPFDYYFFVWIRLPDMINSC